MNPKAMIIGWANYAKDTDVPQERLDKIRNCENNVNAPISALKFKDRYEELNGKICKKCYCPMPAKARQDIESCPCWK